VWRHRPHALLHGQRVWTGSGKRRPCSIALQLECCGTAPAGISEIETSSDPKSARNRGRRGPPAPRLCWGYSEVGSVRRANCPQGGRAGVLLPSQTQMTLRKLRPPASPPTRSQDSTMVCWLHPNRGRCSQSCEHDPRSCHERARGVPNRCDSEPSRSMSLRDRSLIPQTPTPARQQSWRSAVRTRTLPAA